MLAACGRAPNSPSRGRGLSRKPLRSVLEQAALVVSPYGDPIPRTLLRSSPAQMRADRAPHSGLKQQ